MSQTDEPENESADARYENILRNTLLQRTGRKFKRNVDAAILPTQEKESHEDVAERIFDNILKRKAERGQDADDLAPEPPPGPPPLPKDPGERPGDISRTYGELLDDILWPGDEGPEDQAVDSHQTLAESNPPPLSENPYQSMLTKTLQTRASSLPRRGRGAVRVEAASPGTAQGPEPVSHHYSAALDEILGMEEDDQNLSGQDEPSLSQTLYNQKLDQLLWPSQQEVTPQQAKERPPVDEAKLRSVVAEYLQQLILPEPYGLIGVQRQVLDEKYCHFFIRENMHQLGVTLQALETEFTVWIFLQNIELLKRVINLDFIERFRMMIEQMLPPQEKLSPFNKKKEHGLFDRMNSNKFDDVRRLLKAGKTELSDEDTQHFLHFFKARLPEFLKTHRQVLMDVLLTRSEDGGSNPFVSSFLAAIFFSEPFETCFRNLQEHEDRYKQAYNNFLRDKCEGMVNKSDPLVPMILVAMDLFHEKASFFRPAERDTLVQALDLLEGLMRFLSEDYFNKEELLQQFQAMVDTRVQAQFHVEGQSLQALGQEIGSLAQMADQSARIRANHLNAIYERHNKEMSDTYHKRRDTLEKLSQGKGPSWSTRKQFIQRKLKACQQYLTRAPKRAQQPVEISYREYAPEFLLARQKELCASQNLDNDYEKQILEQAFEKANMVLKAMNHSKSTVKFNLKVLFNGEPTLDRFLQAFAEVGQQLQSLQASHPRSETLGYLNAVLHRYLVGLRAPEPDQAEPFYDSQSRIGYIVAYLAHVSHIKLMVNLQYQQVIYDFHSLFELVHALYLLEAMVVQPAQSFGEHYRQMLIPAWYSLLRHCLLVGSGQYHFVANPLALHDYSWHPPLSFGVDAFGDDEFDTLSMSDESEAPARLPSRSLVRSDEGKSLRSRLGRRPVSEPDDEDVADADEEAALPAMPALSGRRRLLPSTPGKFEIYTAPTRRQMQPVNQIEDDDFYKVLSQTQADSSPAPAPAAPPALPPVSSPSPAISLDEPDQATTFVRPRSLSEPEPPAASFTRPRSVEPPADPPRRPGTTPAASRLDPASRLEKSAKPSPPAPPSENRIQRKRWLEITPVPQDNQGYDQMLDSILDGWEQEDPPQKTVIQPAKDMFQPAKEDSLSIVDQILRRNALDGSMDIDGNTSISHTIRRPAEDDY